MVVGLSLRICEAIRKTEAGKKISILNFQFSIFFITFAPTFQGVLAHLARALDWQSKGDRFESDMLHKQNHSTTMLTERVLASLSTTVILCLPRDGRKVYLWKSRVEPKYSESICQKTVA